jgi:hypothetical protein
VVNGGDLTVAVPTSHLTRKGTSVPRTAVVAVLAVALSALAAAPAGARDTPFVGWSGLLPPLTSGFTPTTEDDCLKGRTSCVDKLIRAMDDRLAPLARTCDHDAPFALGYLRTTEQYRRALGDPGFLQDPAFVNHEVGVFAAYYFHAYDTWHTGDRARVPPAWRAAFDAADDRALPAVGNFLLGVNAHIQRDLPFVVAGTGLVRPDGTTRKTDHDRINRVLNAIADDVIAEFARRLDPTADDGDLPGWLDDLVEFQVFPAWRELAWRNAERLASAPDAATRAQVAASIERHAESQAVLLRTALSYGPLRDSRARDAHCAAAAG